MRACCVCAVQVWPVVWQTLTDEGVKMVTSEEASKMATKGWTIVDVRLTGDFDKQHAEGAINLPLFRYVQGTEMWCAIPRNNNNPATPPATPATPRATNATTTPQHLMLDL